MRHWFHSQANHECGNFRAANDELLSLFNDPDARGSRRWHEVFGFPDERDWGLGAPIPCAVPIPAAPPIIVIARPKWSSGSKLFRRW